jgi:23S rRNA (cytosine1962-C5)-methyltransferase
LGDETTIAVETDTLPRVVLEPNRERPLLERHPWVFSGAVARLEGHPGDGGEVVVAAADGTFVARGLFNSRSQIRVRLYRWENEPLDEAFFGRRVREAVALRRSLGLLDGVSSACRLVFSEGDGLSGLVVDRYREWLVVQLTSLALARRAETLLDALEELLSPRGIYLRTEKGILEEEGLELSDGLLRGDAADGPLVIEEAGTSYLVNLRTGQKTGFYLDQRENRIRVAQLGAGLRVADVFCYSGGFSIPLLRAGASSLVGVDKSAAALELARQNLQANGFGESVELVQADAFSWLEARVEAGDVFDLMVLDPPRFARSSRGVAQALRGYARLNALAVRCLAPDGLLVTCSCTGRVTREAFVAMLGSVEARTGRAIRILESRGQASDHPVSPTCPETEYLKCLICKVQ